MRILHVLWETHNAGGVENWLARVAENADRNRYRHDVLVLTPGGGLLVQRLASAGAQVMFSTIRPRPTAAFDRCLRQIIRQHGPYHAVHSHVHYFSGWVLRAAHRAGVPCRIAHSHSDLSRQRSTFHVARAVYWRALRNLIQRHATAGLAVSQRAAADLFGGKWSSDRRWRLLPAAIDLQPFETLVDRRSLRREWGIPESARVLVHVGRMVPEKNHRFLLRVFEQVAGRCPEARLVLIGDGPLRAEIEQEIRRRRLTEHIVLPGVRSDVPRLLRGLADVFVFPSIREGLGLAVVEAQAASLPVVISNAVPDEAVCLPQRVQKLPWSATPEIWADAVLSASSRREESLGDSLDVIRATPFNIQLNVRLLEENYATWSGLTGEGPSRTYGAES